METPDHLKDFWYRNQQIHRSIIFLTQSIILFNNGAMRRVSSEKENNKKLHMYWRGHRDFLGEAMWHEYRHGRLRCWIAVG